MPRGTTAISPGATASGPSSVRSVIAPLLGHEQQLAVGVDEVPVGHGPVRRVDVHGYPVARPQVAVAGHGVEPVDEVGVGAGVGMGSAFQRSRFGSGSISSNGVPRRVPLPMRENLGCAADGMIR